MRLGAKIARLTGLVLASSSVATGIYLPITDLLDWALLPFLLAGALYALCDAIAIFLESRNEGVHLSEPRSHPLRR